MKVLIVDDEGDIRRIGELSLQSVAGWEVVLAESGAEGVAAARAHRPDLILMDMMMPEMDGLTALRLLRQDPDLKGIPVIFMTAKVQRDEVSVYLEAGALGVVRKPFDPMTLSSELTEMLRGSGGDRERPVNGVPQLALGRAGLHEARHDSRSDYRGLLGSRKDDHGG